MTTVDTDELVAWLRQAVEDQHAESLDNLLTMAGLAELYDWVKEDDKALRAALVAEVEAKRARIDLLAQVAASQMILGPSHANQEVEAAFAVRLLCLEAQPLASRPGFRDEWRLT